MPFEEIRHTADWSIRVQAPDLASLFSQAALGMNEIAGVTLAMSPRLEHTFDADSSEHEGLLVAFLSELVFQAEHEKAAFDQFNISITKNHLHVEMTGAPILTMIKAIKAATYHNLKIDKTRDGLVAEIVFDV